MYVVSVTIKVTPGNGERFLEAARKDQEGTLKEPGNIRFDVSQAVSPAAPGEPELFHFYEVYHTKEDFIAHQQTPHYHAFREEVADIMAEPRQGVHFNSVFYTE